MIKKYTKSVPALDKNEQDGNYVLILEINQ